MKVFIILSCLLACAHAVLDLSKWNDWKKSYNRNYDSEEEVLRQKIFYRNLKKIESHNKQADAGLQTYRMALNKFADLTHSEFAKKMHISRQHLSKINPFKYDNILLGKSIPDSLDWRTQGVVSSIRDMENCSASYAFAAVSAIESVNAIASGNLTSLSEQNIVDCSTLFGNMGCDDGDVVTTYEYVLFADGVDTRNYYPYEGKFGHCRFNDTQIGGSFFAYNYIPVSEVYLNNIVANVSPVTVNIDASSPGFQIYSSGVYTDDKCSSIFVNLALLVVGYGSSNGQDYWIVRNAWGTSWGIDGYIWMARNRDNMCGIASSAVYLRLN